MASRIYVAGMCLVYYGLLVSWDGSTNCMVMYGGVSGILYSVHAVLYIVFGV